MERLDFVSPINDLGVEHERSLSVIHNDTDEKGPKERVTKAICLIYKIPKTRLKSHLPTKRKSQTCNRSPHNE